MALCASGILNAGAVSAEPPATGVEQVDSKTPPATSRIVEYRVTPRETDPRILRFDEAHLVLFDKTKPPSSNLLLFLPGSGARAASVSAFLGGAAALGYRVVSLSYNDLPAIVAVCPRDPDPACSAKVRQKRIFGDDVTTRIDDTPAEAIVNRLTRLLLKLDHDHPTEAWGEYLVEAAPKWERIAVAGHSQGAGMAAYIAQRKRVARVILFSGPGDYQARERRLAPWIGAGPGATPADCWFGAYHRKENAAELVARAYQALRVPEAHTRVLTLEPERGIGDNPYHLSVVGNGTTPRAADGSPAYSEDWRFLLGPSQ